MAHGDAIVGNWSGKVSNAVGSQYPSHYLGTCSIQNYYRWYTHLGCQQSTELTNHLPIWMDSYVSLQRRNQIFLLVCFHISKAVYNLTKLVDIGPWGEVY